MMAVHRRVWAVVRVVHPFPVSVVVATSGALLFVAHGGYPGASVLIRGLATVLGCQVAVGALNDYLDRDADRLYQPNKPIPSGLVAPRFALIMAVMGLLTTTFFGATFSLLSCGTILLATSGGLAYDIWLKPTSFSLLGYLVGFLGLFTWIWLVSGNLRESFWLVYPAAALIVTAAHLANAAPDIETDRQQGLKGLAVRLGPRRTVRAIFALYGLSVIPAVVLLVFSRSLTAAALLLASLILTGCAARPARTFATSRTARVTLFRLFAPAVGLFGIGCLIALKGIQ